MSACCPIFVTGWICQCSVQSLNWGLHPTHKDGGSIEHLPSVGTCEPVLISRYRRPRKMSHIKDVQRTGYLSSPKAEKFRHQKEQNQKILTMRAHLQGVTGFISLAREKQKVLCSKRSVNEVSIHTQADSFEIGPTRQSSVTLP